MANRGFATVVSRATFAGARPVHGGMVHVSAEHLAHASLMAGAPHYNAGEGQHVLNPGSGRPSGVGQVAGNQISTKAPVTASAGTHVLPGVFHPGGPGAGGEYRPHPSNPAKGEYRPPSGQQFARPGAPGQFAHPGLPQQQLRPGQGFQQRGFGGFGGGFQMPGRAAPMVRAPTVHAAPSGGAHHK